MGQLLITDAADERMQGHKFTPQEWLESESGETYLADFIVENPGKRPHLWWKTASPKEKYLVFDTDDEDERLETDAAYLARLGELTPMELEMLEDGLLPTRRAMVQYALSNGPAVGIFANIHLIRRNRRKAR